MTKKSGTSVREKRAQRLAAQQRKRRLYYGAAAIGAVVFIALLALLRQANAPSPEDVILPDSLETPPNADGSAWGPADAPVLIEEFSDFQ